MKTPSSIRSRVLVICLFFLPTAVLLLLLLFGQKEVSLTENRRLQSFPVPALESFLTGKYQDELEHALADQHPASEAVKGWVRDGQNALLARQRAFLLAWMPGLRNGYNQISEGYYHYQDDIHRIVEYPLDYASRSSHLQALAAQYRDLPGVRLCVYFIENSRVVDFDHPGQPDRVYASILEAFRPNASDVFAVPDYAFYQAHFYQTDHHWNSRGAYLGYQAIHRLLHPDDGDEGIIQPDQYYTIPVVFQGSYARQTHDLCADEPFSFETYQLPDYTVRLQGRKGTYGHLSQYVRGKYPTDALRNHYAYCFGGDYGLIEYDFGTQGKGNLLVVASSYSNPINALIASGFDRTYFVDLRYYEPWAKAAFDPAVFCREHDICTVLLLGDASLFYVDEPEGEVTE